MAEIPFENMKKSQNTIKKFVKARGWDRQSPDHIVKSISIEAAELLELFQWSNPSASDIQKNKKLLEELKGELADVLIYSLHLANLLRLRAEDLVKRKLALAAKKYPAEIMKNIGRRSLGGREYLAIKRRYRAKKK